MNHKITELGTATTRLHVRSVKTQMSMRICAVCPVFVGHSVVTLQPRVQSVFKRTAKNLIRSDLRVR